MLRAVRRCLPRDCAGVHWRRTRLPGMASKPKTRNPKPETRNSRPDTRNPQPKTRTFEPETRNAKTRLRSCARNGAPSSRGAALYFCDSRMALERETESQRAAYHSCLPVAGGAWCVVRLLVLLREEWSVLLQRCVCLPSGIFFEKRLLYYSQAQS